MNLIIRADASVAVGTGHVMRCLALAQAWQDSGGRVVFAMAECTPSISERLGAEGIGVIRLTAPIGSVSDAQQLLEAATAEQSGWVVLDGYQFGYEYQRVVCAAGLRVLIVDDNADCSQYSAHVVLNQNIHAREELYAGKITNTSLLLGPRYAMLRREFRAWSGRRREVEPAGRNILITMGGSDPTNVTLRVLGALPLVGISGLQAKVIVGGSNPHVAEIVQAGRNSALSIEVVQNPSNMPELMAWADVAVSAAGSTSWEMCFMGLPAVLIGIADNQIKLAEEMERTGIALYAGRGDTVTSEAISSKVAMLLRSAETRSELSLRGQRLVDGAGTERVLRGLKPSPLTLRRAEEADCELLWRWANDPAVRAASFHSEPIPWEDHVGWFQKRLHDPQSLVLVAMIGGERAGQIRFQVDAEGEAVVGLSLAAAYRGLGYAADIIREGVGEAFRELSCSRVHAYIRHENAASQRAFSQAWFQRAEPTIVKGVPAAHFVREQGERALDD